MKKSHNVYTDSKVSVVNQTVSHYLTVDVASWEVQLCPLFGVFTNLYLQP
jgi:hypothetical protein